MVARWSSAANDDLQNCLDTKCSSSSGGGSPTIVARSFPQAFAPRRGSVGYRAAGAPSDDDDQRPTIRDDVPVFDRGYHGRPTIRDDVPFFDRGYHGRFRHRLLSQ